MKTKILSILALAATALFGLSSCDSKWEPALAEQGQVALSSMDVDVSAAETVISRASYDLSEFIVRITATDGNTYTKEWSYGAMPEIFSLPVGDYRVDVISHNVQKAEWERPYYAGSKEFSIENSKITEIGTVVCTFASLKVSVRFTDALRELMNDDVRVSVVANDEGRLEFTPDETRAGYFAVIDGSTSLAATLTGTIGGYVENIYKVWTDVAAGQHRIITFDVKNGQIEPDPETGKIDPSQGIQVDVTYQDVNLNESIDNSEDIINTPTRPGGEEFVDPEDPEKPVDPVDPVDPSDPDKIDFDTDLSFDEPNPVEAGKEYVVTIKAEEGVAHLEVKIDSTNDDFMLSVADLMPDTFDLAYPGTYGEAFESIGLKTGEDVIDKPEVPFDITALVPLLSGFAGEHYFTITVTDNKGAVLSKTLTFKS